MKGMGGIESSRICGFIDIVVWQCTSFLVSCASSSRVPELQNLSGLSLPCHWTKFPLILENAMMPALLWTWKHSSNFMRVFPQVI